MTTLYLIHHSLEDDYVALSEIYESSEMTRTEYLTILNGLHNLSVFRQRMEFAEELAFDILSPYGCYDDDDPYGEDDPSEAEE